ncbi:MAG: hypothetical protein WA865_10975 [Spirulinaceae cyanobacterium]
MKANCFSKSIATAIATGWLLSGIVPINVNPDSLFNASTSRVNKSLRVNVTSLVPSASQLLVKYQKASKPRFASQIMVFNQQEIISK